MENNAIATAGSVPTPFKPWVPKGVEIIVLIMFFVPALGAGGPFQATSTELYSGLGILSEHISFANYMVSVGMSAFAAFLYPYVIRLRPKLIIIGGNSVLVFFNAVCLMADDIVVLAIYSFFIGVFRLMLILCVIFTLMNILTGMNVIDTLAPGSECDTDEGWDKNDIAKSVGQGLVYLFMVSLGQIIYSIEAWVAFEYDWKMIYVGMIGESLFCILLAVLTMRFKSYGEVPPPHFKFNHFANFLSFGIALGSLTYILVYGKTYDWFDDKSIRLAAVICVVAFLVMVYLDRGREGKFLVLRILRLPNVRWACFLYIAMLFLMCSSMCTTVFMQVGMECDNWQKASISLWGLIGNLIACVCIVVFRIRNVSFRWFHFMGFFLIGVAAVYMYFEVQNEGLYDRMKLPTIIRNAGMFLIYVLATTYAFQRLAGRYSSSWICLMLVTRAVLGPASGSAFYGVAMQNRQQYYIERFAADFDRTQVESSEQYRATEMGMRLAGNTEAEAAQMASQSVKGNVQIQATLLTLKDLAGFTVWACLACCIAVLVFPYKKRPLELIRRDVEEG